MSAKLSTLSSPRLDKPFRRTEIKQSYFIVCTFLVAGGYSYFYGRQVFLAPTIGLGLFFIQRLLLLLQELVFYRNNFDLSQTLKLIAKPSSTAPDQSGYGFWISFWICFTFCLTQPPPLETWFDNKIEIFILLMIIMFGIHFQWYDCALCEAYRLAKPFSYSGGSAMAYSFYYGYLKLIAPELLKRIIQFKDKEGIEDEQIPEKKLFVLIPSSSIVLKGHQHCSKTGDIIIENVGEKFPDHRRDRGLIKGRSYKTAIYLVDYNNNKFYVLLVDTPLKTFYETCREQKDFKAVKKEIISSFYYTLNELIEENPDVRDIVKLIYYDDENEDVKLPDVVKDIILKKIEKSKDKQKKRVVSMESVQA